MSEIQTLNHISDRLVNVYLETDETLYRKVQQDPKRGAEAVRLFDFMLSSMERFLTLVREEVTHREGNGRQPEQNRGQPNEGS